MTSGRPHGHGYTAMQIYEALTTLGHAPVFDPQKRPDGPLEQDRPMLIGLLLAVTELVLLKEPRQTAAGVNKAYLRQAVEGQSDSTHLAGMLAVRADRTRMLLESIDGGPILNAAARAAAATSGLLNLWVLACAGPDLDTDNTEMLLRQGIKDAHANLTTARTSVDDLRHQLADKGIKL